MLRVFQVQIFMPESLKTTFMKTHHGVDPQDVFSREPLALVVGNLLANKNPGLTLETILEMADGSKLNFEQMPNEWKHMPAPQIPGLVRITLKVHTIAHGSLLCFSCCKWRVKSSIIWPFAYAVQTIEKPAGHYAVSISEAQMPHPCCTAVAL